MGESFKSHLEKAEHELALPEHIEIKSTAEHARQVQDDQEKHTEKLVEAREQVAELAETEHATLKAEALNPAENKPDFNPGSINSELKSITLQRELNSIRSKLSRSEKVLSKTIHQPVIRVISEGAGKTISRPSGILGGGLLALVGTSAYLYMARHIGFEYNYFVFLVLFAGGFGLGLILELALHVTLRRKHQS